MQSVYFAPNQMEMKSRKSHKSHHYIWMEKKEISSKHSKQKNRMMYKRTMRACSFSEIYNLIMLIYYPGQYANWIPQTIHQRRHQRRKHRKNDVHFNCQKFIFRFYDFLIQLPICSHFFLLPMTQVNFKSRYFAFVESEAYKNPDN